MTSSNHNIPPSTTGGNSQPRIIAEWMSHLLLPGQNVEIRALKKGEKSLSAHFRADQDGLSALENQAHNWDTQGWAVYWIPNPLRGNVSGYAKDADVLVYRWLLLDVEPRRKTETASTAEEKEAARAMLDDLIALFQGLGVHDVATADSGNGYHLLIPFNCPNTTENKEVASQVLHGLDHRWSTEKVKIDPVTFNPSRLVRLYGTTNRKGENTEDRPHRQSRFLTRPLEYSGEAGYQGCKALLARWAAQAKMLDEAREPRQQATQGTAMDRARAYLRKADPAIAGQGGSNECYRLACVLTNGYALSADEAFEAIQEWNQTCVPPWSEKELRHKIDDSIKATNHQKPRGYLLTEGRASTTCNPAGSADTPQQVTRAAKSSGSQSSTPMWDAVLDGEKPPYNSRMSLNALLQHQFPPLEWCVQDLVSGVGLTILGGPKKQGKSWLAIDMAIAVASGGRVLDKQASRGKVVFWTLEDGLPLIQDRLKKIQKANPSLRLNSDNIELEFDEILPPLNTDAGLEAICKELANKPSAVFIDTLAAAKSGKIDENSASEMGELMNNLRRAAMFYCVPIILVAHHGKASQTDAGFALRGSSAIAGASHMNLSLVKGGWLIGEGKQVEKFRWGVRWDKETWRWVRTNQGDAQGEDAENLPGSPSGNQADDRQKAENWLLEYLKGTQGVPPKEAREKGNAALGFNYQSNWWKERANAINAGGGVGANALWAVRSA